MSYQKEIPTTEELLSKIGHLLLEIKPWITYQKKPFDGPNKNPLIKAIPGEETIIITKSSPGPSPSTKKENLEVNQAKHAFENTGTSQGNKLQKPKGHNISN